MSGDLGCVRAGVDRTVEVFRLGAETISLETLRYLLCILFERFSLFGINSWNTGKLADLYSVALCIDAG